MHKWGKGKISIQRMKKKETNEKDWRLISLYTGMVAGLVNYCSMILVLLNLLKIPTFIINVIGLSMGIIVLILIGASRNYKFVDKVHNKRSLESIIEAMSLAGIFGFAIEKVVNIMPLDSVEFKDILPFIFMIILFMAIPLSVYIALRKKASWKHNMD